MKFTLVFLFCVYSIYSLNAAQKDSLVIVSDLKFHSDFEEEMFFKFKNDKTAAFKFFLALDKEMTDKKAETYLKKYSTLIADLRADKIESKKIKTKVKKTYAEVHSRYLQKYINNESFPSIFESGRYNCVSASMIYAIVFDELNIPYNVKVSSEHVYLIANPGTKSIVVETTNPNFMKTIFNGDFKQQYVSHLRDSKLISEAEYKSKSIDEIFEEKFNEVKDGTFNNLPGFQYYNAALLKLQNNELDEGLELVQKAYFFYPEQQVKILLYNCLLAKIDECLFEKVEDVDYFAQFARFEYSERSAVVGMFSTIISQYLQYNDKEEHCEALYKRLISKINDDVTREELTFAFNIQMSYAFQNNTKIEPYLLNALRVKGNHSDANGMLDNYMALKLNRIHRPEVLLDTLSQMKQRFDFEPVNTKLNQYLLIAYLSSAEELYRSYKHKEGAVYLSKFEENCQVPLENQKILNFVESSYRSIAVHYFNCQQDKTAKSIARRGLKYVPDSGVLKAALE